MKKIIKNDSHLGCGPTLGIDDIKKGDVVLVIGSGAGSDCFRASKKVGSIGKVFGVDMDNEKVNEAERLRSEKGCKNVEFKIGLAEDLPVEDNSIDVVISHCVMNLVPNKQKAYMEICRVLKKGGRMYVSDIVLLKKLSRAQRTDEKFINECIKRALLKKDYLKILKDSGFSLRTLLKNSDNHRKQSGKLFTERLEVMIEK